VRTGLPGNTAPPPVPHAAPLAWLRDARSRSRTAARPRPASPHRRRRSSWPLEHHTHSRPVTPAHSTRR